MITILTHPPGFFVLGRLKASLKRIIGAQRGPEAALQSLRLGLDENDAPFQINPPASGIGAGDVVHVPIGADTLRYAIKLKRAGKIKKLVAGPNISVLPTDHQSIMLEKEIDIILQPSEWTKSLYEFLEPSLAGKIKVWPAGVGDPGNTQDGDIETAGAKNEVLIFQKNASEELLRCVKGALDRKGLVYKTIEYGNFKRETYFGLLAACRFMIYLSQSESQGLALHEAWMRNIPTLVWNRGYFEYGEGKKYEGKDISAPYLSSESGMFFKGAADLEEMLAVFLGKIDSFAPRKYSLDHFTHKKSALAYLGEIM